MSDEGRFDRCLNFLLSTGVSNIVGYADSQWGEQKIQATPV